MGDHGIRNSPMNRNLPGYVKKTIRRLGGGRGRGPGNEKEKPRGKALQSPGRPGGAVGLGPRIRPVPLSRYSDTGLSPHPLEV